MREANRFAAPSRPRLRLTAIPLAAAIMALGGVAANSTTLTFDDLPGDENTISNGYGGLNWNNWSDLNGETYELNPSGYQNGVVSSPNVAFNGFGAPATFSAVSGTFTLDSFYVTGAWRNGLNVEVDGYNGATLIDSTSFTINASGPSLEVFNWSGLTSVTLASSGGTNAGFFNDGTGVALDDLAFTTGVPEPSTWAMMLVGFAGLAFASYRSRRWGLDALARG